MGPSSFEGHLSEKEVEPIAGALKGTPWLSVFSTVSRQCQAAAASVEDGPAAPRRLSEVCMTSWPTSVELAKWARPGSGCRPWNASIYVCCCRQGGATRHLEVLKWLVNNDCPGVLSFTCYAAADGGQAPVRDCGVVLR